MEDYALKDNLTNTIALNRLIRDIGIMLARHGRKLNDYDLPTMSEGFENINSIPKLIMDKLSISLYELQM
ncbi:hypothetical protein LIER_12152 [Lithospermum erythrorhizon]|uniref:Uncharacterized protein n=1 Tax=Lithospermum erythrorhizon TaxID=34254 RepID=A0AAV3PQP9_LITER